MSTSSSSLAICKFSRQSSLLNFLEKLSTFITRFYQAFDRVVKLIGATAHYVSDVLDEGPIIEQEVLRVTHVHNPENLKELGKDIESTVLSRAVRYHIEQRIFINGNKTVVFRE